MQFRCSCSVGHMRLIRNGHIPVKSFLFVTVWINIWTARSLTRFSRGSWGVGRRPLLSLNLLLKASSGHPKTQACLLKEYKLLSQLSASLRLLSTLKSLSVHQSLFAMVWTKEDVKSQLKLILIDPLGHIRCHHLWLSLKEMADLKKFTSLNPATWSTWPTPTTNTVETSEPPSTPKNLDQRLEPLFQSVMEWMLTTVKSLQMFSREWEDHTNSALPVTQIVQNL